MPTRLLPTGWCFPLSSIFSVLLLLSLPSCTSEERKAFNAATDENTVEAFQDFLSQFPEGPLASEADSLLMGLLPPVPFTSERDGGFNLFTVRVDGTEVRSISDVGAYELSPTLSPEGERVAFTSEREGGRDLFIMRLDGTYLKQVTTDVAGVSNLAWSPTGAQIAFAAIQEGRNSEIFVIDADGSDLTRITDTPGAEMYPTWSPDGSRLAFAFDETDDPARVLSTAMDDFLTTGGLIEMRPFRGDIWIMEFDGSGRTQLTDYPGNDSHPSWSPNGSRIAFSSNRNGNSEIYLMNPDGSDPVRLTQDPASDRGPLWYPFWNKILFASDRGGGVDVWMMNPDGSEPTRLTVHEANDFLR